MRVLLFITFIVLSFVTQAKAVNKYNKAASSNIRVGVVMEMPFAQNVDGHYSGIAVDIWDRIATLNKWHYTYIPISNNVDHDLDRLTLGGDLDVIIGPILVSATRLERGIDFTRPFYLSSVGIITHKHQLGIFGLLYAVLTPNLLHAVLILFVSFFIYLHVLWFFERGKSDEISHGYYQILTRDIWLHIFKEGFGIPNTFGGRIVGLIWVVFTAIIFAYLNASFTSSMTIAKYENSNLTSTMHGLQSARIAGVDGQLDVETA